MKKSIFYDHLIAVANKENQSIEKIINFSVTLGYKGVDLQWRGENEFIKTYKLLEKSGMAISSVYRFWNLSDLFDENEADSFLTCISKYGCNIAMIIPLKSDELSVDANFQKAISTLNALCDIAQKHGATVAIEDYDGYDAVICNTVTIKRALHSIPKLRHTFDTGNYAYFNESMIDALKLFATKTVYVHLKDRTFASPESDVNSQASFYGRKVKSCAVGDGFVEIEECIKLLSESGYNGFLSVELFGNTNITTAMQKSAKYIDYLLANTSKKN